MRYNVTFHISVGYTTFRWKDNTTFIIHAIFIKCLGIWYSSIGPDDFFFFYYVYVPMSVFTSILILRRFIRDFPFYQPYICWYFYRPIKLRVLDIYRKCSTTESRNATFWYVETPVRYIRKRISGKTYDSCLENHKQVWYHWIQCWERNIEKS